MVWWQERRVTCTIKYNIVRFRPSNRDVQLVKRVIHVDLYELWIRDCDMPVSGLPLLCQYTHY